MGVEVRAGRRRSLAGSSSSCRSAASFFKPDLVPAIGLGPILAGLGGGVAVQQRRADRQRAAQRPVPGPRPGARATRRHASRPERPGLLPGRRRPRRAGHPARARPRDADVQRPAPRARPAAGALVHADHRRAAESLGGHLDRRPGRPGLPRPRRPRRRTGRARLAAAPGQRGRRAAAHDAGGAAEGDLRDGRQRRGVRRDGLRAPRPRKRVRAAAARPLDAAVRRAARRRSLLLRERSRARADPAPLRDRLPRDARPAHRARRGRGPGTLQRDVFVAGP